ncbi:isochorismate synthase [Cellulomonas marina]|uniref:isochorismate synthase n=1 Tax=Cellulomonas marina TaxID=988821 RepID=A0A1I0XJB6_9CELL|nr:isochorismate synthase [Cellulomonas marina]GIG30093.1 isochorismate synthase [Cellulomonas marina]SFB01081.1 menaquinone-specific isochorismate synthase [Cellulomonas marina]
MSATLFAASAAVAHLLVRTVAVDPAEVGELVDLAPPEAPLLWVRRGDGLVAWGEALRFEVSGPTRFADAERAWQRALDHAIVRDEVRLPGTGPVAFGSFAFDDTSARGGVVVVPRVVVGRRGDRAWITTVSTDARLGAAPTPARVLRRQPPVAAPGVVVDEGPPPAAWGAVVARGIAAVREGEVDKVVLARDVHVRTEQPLDLRWPLRRLVAEYPSCWTFSVDGLLGATPELLVRSEKGLVTSRVLAGTIRRTGDEAADLARAAILAHSSKDLEEHEYAVASVAQAIAPSCSSINVPEAPFVLHLPNVLHLASDVTGVLAGRERHPTSLALAAALHPTAAVCGTPTSAAREVIRRVEGMDRGRYAGPVGWFGADGDGEWGIALRSAEVDPGDPRRLRLFAGCGIVGASDPAAEVAESEAKLEPMRHALGS